MDWQDLANMRLVAECVTRAALARTESRGAHQREDHARFLPEWELHQAIRMTGETLAIEELAS